VTLRNLVFVALGSSTDGIEFTQGDELHVEECSIAGMGANGIEVSAAGTAIVKNTVLRGNHNAGFYAVGTAAVATLDHVQSESNVFGVFANFGARITVSNSLLANNNTGVWVLASSGSSTTAEVTRSVVRGRTNGAPILVTGMVVEATPGSEATIFADENFISIKNPGSGSIGFRFLGSGGSEIVNTRENNTVIAANVVSTGSTLTPAASH